MFLHKYLSKAITSYFRVDDNRWKLECFVCWQMQTRTDFMAFICVITNNWLRAIVTFRAQASVIVKNLLSLTVGATLGEHTSLEELVSEFMKSNDLSTQAIQILWEYFTMKHANTTEDESRAALLILGMAARLVSQSLQCWHKREGSMGAFVPLLSAVLPPTSRKKKNSKNGYFWQLFALCPSELCFSPSLHPQTSF